MTFEDNRLTGRIESEPIDVLVEWLEASIGLRLTAFATRAKQTDVRAIAHGDSAPSVELERRLRNLYAVTRFLTLRDRAGTAHDWLMSPNPDLQGRAPADLLREGESPEPVWFAAAPTF
ncbi:MAG TPA: antitoxin Xre/MbcA/ParS toxin-binding domain-containing protein [Thermoleophilaceae bacterium]|jgi:uncharacterized protein (DUF2384 family)